MSIKISSIVTQHVMFIFFPVSSEHTCFQANTAAKQQPTGAPCSTWQHKHEQCPPCRLPCCQRQACCQGNTGGASWAKHSASAWWWQRKRPSRCQDWIAAWGSRQDSGSQGNRKHTIHNGTTGQLLLYSRSNKVSNGNVNMLNLFPQFTNYFAELLHFIFLGYFPQLALSSVGVFPLAKSSPAELINVLKRTLSRIY